MTNFSSNVPAKMISSKSADIDLEVISLIEPIGNSVHEACDCSISETMILAQEETEQELGEDLFQKIEREDERRKAEKPRLLQLALESASSLDGMDTGTFQELKNHVHEAKNRDQQLDLLLLKAAQYSGFITRNQQASELNNLEIEKEADRENGSRMKQFRQPTTMTGGRLKTFQLEGIRWLATLWENGLSGILADEMGLGKTIEVIGLFAYLSSKGCTGPYIITAPLATLPNWCNEFKKWVPSMNFVLYHGDKSERTKIRQTHLIKSLQQSPTFPIVITSYEICIIDRRYLGSYDWKYLVVDEGQRIKNYNCRLVRDLKKLKTENRILLTGTPIQNSLDELWSLLNFVSPAVFDDLNNFKSWFQLFNADTVEGVRKRKVDDDDELVIAGIMKQERSDWIVTKLHEILRPFLLRRTKQEVSLLNELCLPSKTEVIVYCPLSELQTRLYELTSQYRLREIFPDESVSEMNKLMNLRKCCNHPFMFGEPLAVDVDNNLKESGDLTYVSDIDKSLLVSTSGKMQVLDSILQSHQTGRQVLIFSQFTIMLDILEDYLNWREMKFVRIDGTVGIDERRDAIESFTSITSKVSIFLLSTRAGGLGLNLATADTVILFDSDWNPQVDLQAMDRAHRIGQTKPVIVYRLICRGTVEADLMMSKQNEKRRLERITIQAGGFNQSSESEINLVHNVDIPIEMPSSTSSRTMTLKHLYSLLLCDTNSAKREKVDQDSGSDNRILDREFLIGCGKASFDSFEII